MVIIFFTSSGHVTLKFTFLLSGDTIEFYLGHFIPGPSNCSPTARPGRLQSFHLTFLAIAHFHSLSILSSFLFQQLWPMVLRCVLLEHVPRPCPSFPEMRPIMLFFVFLPVAWAICARILYLSLDAKAMTRSRHVAAGTTLVIAIVCPHLSTPL